MQVINESKLILLFSKRNIYKVRGDGGYPNQMSQIFDVNALLPLKWTNPHKKT